MPISTNCKAIYAVCREQSVLTVRNLASNSLPRALDHRSQTGMAARQELADPVKGKVYYRKNSAFKLPEKNDILNSIKTHFVFLALQNRI